LKVKAMTNREWVKKHVPYAITDLSLGGVYACPYIQELENQKCKRTDENSGGAIKCYECWNLPAKRNGKYIMRKEVRNEQ
jgi:hypothetical protein